jgi:zinc/manganese transport system permease protein
MFEMFNLPFMKDAFIVSAMVGLVLAYLGVHVVGRGIVFVDLALGQISSLGVAVAAFIGATANTIPIVFTLVGAFLLSLIHIKDKRLRLEAVIGIIYAIASAMTVMFISKTPHGDSDIQEVLFGNILSVDMDKVKSIGIIFGSIALLHLLFYKKFFALTESFDSVEKTGTQTTFTKGMFRFWNFLFYISIGLTIVFAVKINGVIPVFSFLIIPSVSAIMLSKNSLMVVILAFAISILGIFFGLNLSYQKDFPAGSSLVTVLGAIFLLVALISIVKMLVRKKPV